MLFRNLVLAALAAWFAGAASASADTPSAEPPNPEPPDWAALASVEEVDVLTTDADGDPRETVVWFALYEGVAYLRTSGGSRWGDNIEREADVVLRVAGDEYPLRATRVSDEALLEGIHATFREKYGWFDAVAGVMRGRSPRIMLLAPRD
jgi:hypothetical protein